MITQPYINDVERLSTTKVRLSWQIPKQNPTVNIYIGDTADQGLDHKTLLCSTTKSSIDLDVANNKRCYFLLEIGDQCYMTAERVLPLDGAHNFRDIGGYINNENKYVKWGKLYRSDHLHNLSDQDVAYLKTAGIHSIVDYRNEKEWYKQPNRIWDNTIKTFNLIPDASSAELAAKASNDHEKIQELIKLSQSTNSAITIDGSGHIMQKQYQDFVRNPQTIAVYRELINIILDTKNMPIVQHCRGGKDRTGFGIAIILTILDVKYELILNDYAMTGKLRHDRNLRRMNEYQKETNNKEVLAFLYSMMETRNSYLEAAFNEMKKCYGSINGYLEKALKLTVAEKQELKSLYLY